MKIAVRYYTRSGNTEKLAKAIAEAVGVQAESVPLAPTMCLRGNSISRPVRSSRLPTR